MVAMDLNDGDLANLSVDLGGSTLRSAGTLKTGRLATTEARRGLGRRSTVSIPSKFETVLLDPSNESNAFGNRTHRFKRQLTDQPGPGAYYNKPTFIRDMSNRGSVSHKGSITFASSSTRFRDAASAKGTPGPGSYRSPPTTLAARGDAASAAKMPGPGSYDPYAPTAAMGRDQRHGNSNFRSTVSRMAAAQGNTLGPAPGAYNVAAASETLRMQGKLVNGKLPENVVFRSRVPATAAA
ncbi:hypothetical protein SO694_00057058 [Aureococcus anophagefferens]|uniref:Flagellar associated protein n=1 Tax=Aureococcus anophagefferens TaxID=44056 RepID=A0ABR1FX61_AURAN